MLQLGHLLATTCVHENKVQPPSHNVTPRGLDYLDYARNQICTRSVYAPSHASGGTVVAQSGGRHTASGYLAQHSTLSVTRLRRRQLELASIHVSSSTTSSIPPFSSLLVSSLHFVHLQPPAPPPAAYSQAITTTPTPTRALDTMPPPPPEPIPVPAPVASPPADDAAPTSGMTSEGAQPQSAAEPQTAAQSQSEPLASGSLTTLAAEPTDTGAGGTAAASLAATAAAAGAAPGGAPHSPAPGASTLVPELGGDEMLARAARGTAPLANQVAGHAGVMSDESGSLVIKVGRAAVFDLGGVPLSSVLCLSFQSWHFACLHLQSCIDSYLLLASTTTMPACACGWVGVTRELWLGLVTPCFRAEAVAVTRDANNQPTT